ncbi:MAG TPA: ABC transporter permease, partial [Gammaproteobacteria bacterium]|nr:ABC transporter permease [Gammaproteobacteria bacterium]
AGVLCGVLPALASGSSKAIGALRDGGRNATLSRARHRTRNVLVVTQVALAFALVIGSGLMVRSFDALRSVDPGFQADGVLTFNVRPLPTKYAGPEPLARFYDSLIERLEAVPGVTRAGGINALPLGAGTGNLATVIEEFPPAEGEFPPGFFIYRATPGYFEAMSIPVVEGRSLTPDDHHNRLGSVIINSSLKERYWPSTSALGKRLNISGIRAQVVGVVGDVHTAGLDVEAPQVLYLPMLDAVGANALMAVGGMTITVRTSVEPLSVVPAIRAAIAELDADLPIANVRSMQDVVGTSLSRSSFMMTLLVIAALIALFLGSIGIYGVLSYIVTTRTAEIGVRSALGASPERLRRLVLFQGLRLAGVGVLIGVAGAIVLGRVIEAQLYGVEPVDPVTLGAGAAIFLAVAVLASLLPAIRAARTAPVDALRAG